MKFGMVRAAAVTPVIAVGDTECNTQTIISRIKILHDKGVEIAVFPELCITGYTAADLFFTRSVLDGALRGIKKIAAATPRGMLVFFGAPIAIDGRLYNCAVAVSDGKVLGAIPKTELPDYSEFYEKRYFTTAFEGVITDNAIGFPVGRLWFECENLPGLVVGAEVCEDMWVDVPPSVEQTRGGATVICNLSASDEVVGKPEYRRLLVKSLSGRLHCAYIYADAGNGESSTDLVFSGHDMIAENGIMLTESAPFASGECMTEIDVERLDAERRKIGVKPASRTFLRVPFSLLDTDIALIRPIPRQPFVPQESDTAERAEFILSMQARGLKTRLEASKAKTAVIGVSGGLDSTLALFVCNRAAGAENVTAVTMPAFGTTDRTFNNAKTLCDALGIKLNVIDVKPTVTSHLSDIKHTAKDVTYENAQARIRTVTLFDIANKLGGIVVGTGDLSELALGWATYNGDHMSSYGVNAGVPKTLVKYLVRYEGDRLGGKAKSAATDILNTEISPELLPPENGKISQKTEEILGSYELHDFFMYYYVRFGLNKQKIAYLAAAAFPERSSAEIQKTLDVFFKRFFAAQFKRSCLPDGVKIGSVSFSPRSDFRMPSDAKLPSENF